MKYSTSTLVVSLGILIFLNLGFLINLPKEIQPSKSPQLKTQVQQQDTFLHRLACSFHVSAGTASGKGLTYKLRYNN
ncbi:MAG: hypothetical protein AAGI38_08545 [Bacteroidota bacterium]